MSFKVEAKRIGIHTYKVTQLDAITGRKAFVRLAKLIGPSMGLEEREAIAGFLSRLEEADMDYFCDLFASVTEVSGGKYSKASPQLDSVFLSHFAGEYKELIEWLTFCVMLNFQSFLGAKPDQGAPAQ